MKLVKLLQPLSYRVLGSSCPRSTSQSAVQYSTVQCSTANSVTVYGGYGSPYTRKVEAALRYKRVPFIRKDLMPGNITGDWDKLRLSHIKAKVIPVVQFPDGSARNDSTPLLQELDERYPERKILPANQGARFLSLVLEDMFDEWGTKVMFGTRWQMPVDQVWTGRWLGLDFMMGKGTPLEQVREFGEEFGSRQLSRMHMVGCKDKATVDRSFQYFASTLDSHLEKGSMFITGPTPTVADFALYGQFSQLLADCSPDRLIREQFPSVWAWIRKFEDLSGEEGAAFADQDCLLNFFRFAGHTYFPFLQANRDAVAKGEKDLQVEIMGDIVHRQPAFKYQDKCFKTLQSEYSKLSGADVTVVDSILKETNTIHYFK